jgi:hypothetical protein
MLDQALARAEQCGDPFHAATIVWFTATPADRRRFLRKLARDGETAFRLAVWWAFSLPAGGGPRRSRRRPRQR